MLLFNLINILSPLSCKIMELKFPVEMANSEASPSLQNMAVIDDHKKQNKNYTTGFKSKIKSPWPRNKIET